MRAGDWCYSLAHDEPCRVVGVDAVWGEQTAQVWLARRDAVVRIRLDLPYSELAQFKIEQGEEMVAWAQSVDQGREVDCMEEAVRQLAARLILMCRDYGQCPGWEILIDPPGNSYYGAFEGWRIGWEAGPIGWAAIGSREVAPKHLREGEGWHTEPHYQFDLCFVEE